MEHIPAKKWRETFKLVPRLSVDAVLIEDKKILLVQRFHEPFKGYWSLPGGFVDLGERISAAAERELREETGIRAKASKLIGVYDDPKRDPRGHVISISFIMKRISGKIMVSPESLAVKYFDIKNLPQNMSHDHRKIIKDALRITIKSLYK